MTSSGILNLKIIAVDEIYNRGEKIISLTISE
jgi:hypothetical protein